jgi:hypothetical protein
MSALHGDAYYPANSISLTFGYDLFCAKSCTYTLEDSTSLQAYKHLVENEYSYNIYIDALPASYQTETECVFVTLILLFHHFWMYQCISTSLTI